MKLTTTQLMKEHLPSWLRQASVLLLLLSLPARLLAQNGAVTMTQSFSYTGQIVTWTVPTGVTSLTIEARGAEGGDVVNRRATAGKGAIVVARVSVTPGQALSVLVGQSLSGRSAGGGGSFVAAPGSAGAPTALVVAGGGGGASTINGDSEAKHGQSATSGGTGGFAFSGNNNNPGSGGTNANGGGSGANGAGGGGGFTGNGGGMTTYPNAGGRSFTNGGAGGSGAAAGSYGGGGSSDEGVTSGGGGGGYSGGGAGYTGVGGGGGSYYPSGTSLSVVSGVTGNSGNGLVTISYTPPPTITNFTVGPGAACVGDVITASLTVGNVSGSYSYTLTETNSGATYQFTTSNNPTSIRFVYDSPGVRNYSLRVVSNDQEATAGPRTVTINALPTQYNVTGSGSYCSNATGRAVGLSGSQPGVSYQLLRSGTPLGSPQPGTGNALNFGPQPAGTYTVQATNTSTSCQQTMTGSAVITAAQPPTVTLSNDGPITCTKPSVTLTAGGGNTYVFSAGATQGNGGNTATVTAAGTYTVTATNSTNGCSSFTTTTVTANTATPSVSNPAVTTATQTVAFSQRFTASGGTAPYSFSLESGTLPDGLTLRSDGVLSGSPTQSGNFSFRVRATGANGCSGVGDSYMLSVSPAVTMSPTLNTPASGTTTNGRPLFSGSAPSGSAVMVVLSGPSAQTLDAPATNGQFRVTPGTPLASGVYSAYAVAMSNGQTTSPPSNTLTFTVDNTPPSVQLSASVGSGATTSSQPTSFTASFSEPVTGFSSNGISVSNGTVSNGTVSGFVGSGASYSFSVTASSAGPVSVSIPASVAQDGVGNPNTASASYPYTFQAPTITLSPPSGNLPGGTQGIAYSVAFSASGGSGTYTYALSGTPPPGMTLTGARLSGIPTTSGSFRFRITATDNSAAPGPYSGFGDYIINIAPQPMTAMPMVSTPANGTVTNTTQPTYSGTAPANSRVSVFVNGNSVGQTTATGGGSFSLQQPTALSDGAYQVYVTAQQSGQSVSNSSNVNSFTVDATAPTVVLSSAQVSSGGTTSTSVVSFTANFSESVTGFSQSGINVSNGSVSGFMGSGAAYSFNVTANSAGAVSVSIPAGAAQDGVGNPNTASQSYPYTYQPTPTSFTITGASILDCQVDDPSRSKRYRVSLQPQYQGQDNTQPTSFSVANELSSTTAPGPYTIYLWGDNTQITLVAKQPTSNEARFAYRWQADCPAIGGNPQPPTQPQPPTTSGIPNQSATVNQPYRLDASQYFSDPNNQPLTYTSTALPSGLTLSGSVISGVPSQSGVSSITVTATNPSNQTVASAFQLTINPATTQPPTTQPGSFTITGASILDCQLDDPSRSKRYRVSLQPQYQGQDNTQPTSFSVLNELSSTTAPGPYTVYLWGDNTQITLVAKQPTSNEARFVYRWQADCPASNGQSRRGAETPAGLQVRLLGNPVAEGQLHIGLRGVAGQPAELRLLTQSGRLLSVTPVESVVEDEPLTLAVSADWGGLLLLQVRSGSQQQTVKVIQAR